jgi:GntR family transcriptional regulator
MAKALINRPLYLQLRDALVQRIANGDWRPGAAIPNEANLAEEFGVSPGTMRKALDLLEAERLLTRKQGRGTFINDPASDGLAVRFSNIRNASGHRITGDVRVGSLVQAPATDSEIAHLCLQRPDEVYRVRRFRSHNGRLYMIEDAALPAALFPGLVQQPSLADRVVGLARHYGVLLARSQERVSIASPEKVITDALGHPAGAFVLRLDRVVFSRDGRPIEWRVGYCHLGDEQYVAEMA